MSIGTTFLKVQKIVIKNAPTILAVCGAIGAAASVALSIDGTLKAQKELEKKAREEKGESYYKAKEAQHLIDEGMSNTDICKTLKVKVVNTPEEANEYVTDLVKFEPISTGDKAKIYIKSYGPAALMFALSAFCIFSGNHISKTRILQLTGALALSRKSLSEYKDKVEEIIGTKKAQEINDEVIQERILRNPPTDANTYIPNMGNRPNLTLWYDVQSDRYFYSNTDIIRRAELEAQRQLEKNGVLTRNDVYGILGIREIDLADGCRWVYDPDDSGVRNRIIFKTGAFLDDNGCPVGTLEMNDIDLPSDQWCGEI